MKIKEGDILILCSLMVMVKVISVRTTGNVVRIWVKHKDREFSMAGLKGSDQFVIKAHEFNDRSHDIKVMKLSSFITAMGWILAGFIAIYFFA
ncbi:hypothetical protein ACX818_001327 [Acinetobacter baumannii]